MSKRVGLWIDHRKAVIVTLSGDTDTTQRIESDVEQDMRHPGNARANAPDEREGSMGADTRARRVGDQLDSYYEAVMEHLVDAEAILICGPGEAKGELKSRLDVDGLGGLVTSVQKADRMTDRQVTASVRRWFGVDPPKGEPPAQPRDPAP